MTRCKDILDRYLTGTRLRLREVREDDGIVTRKLGHKVRLRDGPTEVACTNLYLDDEEWRLLPALPRRELHERRHLVRRDGFMVATDGHQDGTLVAEIDDRDNPSDTAPAWLDVHEDVTLEESWTGAFLAR